MSNSTNVDMFLVDAAGVCTRGLSLSCCVPLGLDGMQDSKHSRKPWQDAASSWT